MKNELHDYSGKADSVDNNTEPPKTVENDFQKKIRESIIANVNYATTEDGCACRTTEPLGSTACFRLSAR